MGKTERGILVMVFIRWTEQEIWEMEEAEIEKLRINHITPVILKSYRKKNAYLQRRTTPQIECCKHIPCS